MYYLIGADVLYDALMLSYNNYYFNPHNNHGVAL